jgi:hypothetical protein
MTKTPSLRALITAMILALAAGCSGSSTTPASSQSSSFVPSSDQVGPGMRLLPGPAVAGPMLAPLMPHRNRLRDGWPAKKKKRGQILFVADNPGDVVLMYDPKIPNPSAEGQITTGIDYPAGLAVDTSGALYVANEGNSTITIYPAGSTSPSLTISDGLSSPYGIAVDSSGNIFASNLGNDTVVAYKSGATSPYESISFLSLGQPVGVAVDGKNNVWVACDFTNSVYEIPAGSSTPANSGLTNLNGPIGISFGKKDVIYVSNYMDEDVNIYTYGTTTPSGRITDGIEFRGPTLNGFTKSGSFFQSNQNDNVVGYMQGQTATFSTISGIDPLGIASSPLLKN